MSVHFSGSGGLYALGEDGRPMMWGEDMRTAILALPTEAAGMLLAVDRPGSGAVDLVKEVVGIPVGMSVMDIKGPHKGFLSLIDDAVRFLSGTQFGRELDVNVFMSIARCFEETDDCGGLCCRGFNRGKLVHAFGLLCNSCKGQLLLFGEMSSGLQWCKKNDRLVLSADSCYYPAVAFVKPVGGSKPLGHHQMTGRLACLKQALNVFLEGCVVHPPRDFHPPAVEDVRNVELADATNAGMAALMSQPPA